VRPVWYVGVIGYMVFFLYRYYISEKRKKAVENFQLIEKVKANACLTNEDREVVVYLLSSIKKSPENVNYFIIFLLSILAIIADIGFMVFK
jgi:CDP-diglyceride synthetase